VLKTERGFYRLVFIRRVVRSCRWCCCMGGFVGRVTIKMIVDEFTGAKLCVCVCVL